MKYSFFLQFLCLTVYCFSQSKQELKNIDTIDSIVYANIDINEKNSYLIYSVENKIIVIDSIKREVIYLHRTYPKQKMRTKKLSNDEIVSLFIKTNIKRGMKNYSYNDYKNSCIGTYVYLAIIDNKQKKFEFNLPFIFLCEKNNIKYPFDYKSLNYLNLLLNNCNYN